MSPRFSHWLDTALLGGLAVTVAAVVYGHWGGPSVGLSLTDSYVTEYIKRAPHWPWLVVAAFSLAVVHFLLAFAFLHHAGRSSCLRLGCLFLAATSMAQFFAAYAPVRRVEQPPPPRHAWWTPSWWFTARTSLTPYDHGLADAYSDVHYRATRLVVVSAVTGVLLLGVGHLGHPGGRAFGLGSIAAGLAMSLFFFMGDRLTLHRGLWQRIGFGLLFLWLWQARYACRPPPPTRHPINRPDPPLPPTPPSTPP
jgi:hypothetical protein